MRTLLLLCLGLVVVALAEINPRQVIEPPAFIGQPSDSALFGSCIYLTSDKQRMIAVGFIQSDGSAYASILMKDPVTGNFTEYGDPLVRGLSATVADPTPGGLVETTCYISDDGDVVIWGFYDFATDEDGFVYLYYNDSGVYQHEHDFGDPDPAANRFWARAFTVSPDASKLAISATSTTVELRTITVYERAVGSPPSYNESYTILGNATGADDTFGRSLTFSRTAQWLGVTSDQTHRYYIYDGDLGGEPVFSGSVGAGDADQEWDIVAFNSDEDSLRVGVARTFTSDGIINIRFYDSSWDAFDPIQVTTPTPESGRQCQCLSFCSNARSMICGGGAVNSSTSLLVQLEPYNATSTWTPNDTLIVPPFVPSDTGTRGLTPSSTKGLSEDGTEALIGYSGLTLDSYGGRVLFYDGLPSCADAPEPPVAPPVAAPVASPVTPPVAAPVAPPTAAPVATPTATPVSAPTTTPVAAPTSVPTSTPASEPSTAPTAAPSNTTAPINETVTPAMEQAGTITVSILGATEGLLVIVLIIVAIAIAAQ
jgi:hypothetical protein